MGLSTSVLLLYVLLQAVIWQTEKWKTGFLSVKFRNEETPAPAVKSAISFSSGQVISKRSKSVPFRLDGSPLMINAGNNPTFDHIPGTQTYRDPDIAIERTIRPSFFQSYRSGADFTYHFRGRGTFELQLGFAEIDPSICSRAETRKFSVSVKGSPVAELQGLNVFKKVGCGRAYLWKTTVDLTKGRNLFIRFTANDGSAMVSFILMRTIVTSCTPESLVGGSTSDHLAHSVPGDYPPINSRSRAYLDNDDNGFEEVDINGDGSHSHFFDVTNNIVGRITVFEWTSPDTSEFVSSLESFRFKFYLGTTRLLLKVVDNVCSTNTAETSITVAGSITAGTYCYFYPGLKVVPEVGPGMSTTSPSASRHYMKTIWDFRSLPFASSAFSARCTFFLEVPSGKNESTIAVSTKSSGIANVFRSREKIIADSSSKTVTVPLGARVVSFEVTYIYTNFAEKPFLALYVDGLVSKSVSYDQKNTFPVLLYLSTSNVSAAGGATVRIKCSGLSEIPKAVLVGETPVKPSQVELQKQFVFFTMPAVQVVGPSKITLLLKNGIRTNELKIMIQAGPGDDPVSFRESEIKDARTGKSFKVGAPTSIRIGMDGKMYIGTLNAQVHKVTYDFDTLEVSHSCTNKPLRDARFKKDGKLAQRDILGLALDPRDSIPRPYVTTQTLFWFSRDLVDKSNFIAWRNGAVDRLKPGSDPTDKNICLVFDKRIVENLPVSNHDHGVNGLEFTQSGDLLISVGGYTNQGLPGKRLGERWDVPLSGCIIEAKLSKGSTFNGVITYSNDTHPRYATVTSGDVSLVATGLRNAFALALHSSGRLYTVDNGPNAGFGNTAVTCSERDRDIVYPIPGKPSDWPGTVKHNNGPISKAYSLTRPDSLEFIRRDGATRFYGHPNFSRGECGWIDPLTGRDARGRRGPGNYEGPLQMLKSSVNAVVEYHVGGVFGGNLQGKLVLSTFKNRESYVVEAGVRRDGKGPEVISEHGGLAGVVDGRGRIVFARVQLGTLLGLVPVVGRLVAGGRMVVMGAMPFRHGREGGGVLRIGGMFFGQEVMEVKVGGKECELKSVSKNWICCTMPKAGAGEAGKVVDIEVLKKGGESEVLKRGVWYMKM